MRKVLRWFARIAGVLLLLTLLLYAVASLRGPTDEQTAALSLLKDPGPPAGRNGFALIWLLGYDVPDSERERVLAQDVRRFAQQPSTAAEIAAGFITSAEGRYPHVQARSGDSRYCRWRDEESCLAKVRAEVDATARLIAEDASLLARVRALADYGYVRNAFPPRLDMPLPSYRQLAYPLTQHAHAFVAGDTDTALAGVCRDISSARMLIGSGDNLVTSMIGAAMLEGNAKLLADMLAELPADRALPAVCARAVALAAPDEFNACTTMRGEARYMFEGMRHLPQEYAAQGPLKANLWSLVYDQEKTLARMAPRLSWYCTAAPREAVVADIPVPSPPPTPSAIRTPFQCFDNIAGCVLADVGDSDLTGYQHRLQDARMRLMTLGALLWLREHPSNEPTATRLAQLPAALVSTRRALTLAADGSAVSIPLFDTQQAERWSVPLPGSRLPGLQSDRAR